jgi:hypothetical protein
LPFAVDPGSLPPVDGREEARMERQGAGDGAQRTTVALAATVERRGAAGTARRAPEWTRCDACGEGMQSMGHCKWLCRACGFLRTCIDTV